METKVLPQRLFKEALKAERNEITEHFVYSELAREEKVEVNKKILFHIAADEKKHYEFWKSYSGKTLEPDNTKLYFYILVARIVGLTFALKLMERGERFSQENYKKFAKYIPRITDIEKDEVRHEFGLLSMIDEKRLQYIGSMILGINDALVELTGALAGFTLALQQSRIVVMTGIITGIAASLSMGISEYLSTQAESNERNPLRSGIYTGGMYFFVVILLVSPYFLHVNPVVALIITLTIAIVIICMFSFYISVIKGVNFRKRFIQMASLSLGVAAFTFLIGFLMQKFLGVRI